MNKSEFSYVLLICVARSENDDKPNSLVICRPIPSNVVWSIEVYQLLPVIILIINFQKVIKVFKILINLSGNNCLSSTLAKVSYVLGDIRETEDIHRPLTASLIKKSDDSQG